MKGSTDPVEAHLRGLDDAAVLRVVSVEASDYTPEALALARDEIARRGLSLPTAEEHLARFPSDAIGVDGFCGGCREQTEPGPLRALYGVGFFTRMFGGRDRCHVCRSSVYSRWFCLGVLPYIVPLPVLRLGVYRLLPKEPGFLEGRVGRRLRRAAT